MAPPAADIDIHSPASATQKTRTIPEIKKTVAGLTQSSSFPKPLQYSGTLDNYDSFDVTSVIGREVPKLQLTDILNDDEKVRDLAILGMWNSLREQYLPKSDSNTVSQRGVLFFRNQDIGIEDQKILGQKLGVLTGKPETSKVHFLISRIWLQSWLLMMFFSSTSMP